jgi:S1-C subfamily serine protease
MKTDSPAWAFPRQMQPKRDGLGFDLDTALAAMVRIDALIPDEAYTAGILGTERQGYGCVIGDDGLVLTIGYLITEAQTIWLTGHQGHTVPGHVLAVDFASGFGLVLPALPLRAKPLARGASRKVGVGDDLVVLGHGGIDHALATRLVAREVFAGYWEYVLDDALFTSPAHPQWGGTAVLDSSGALVGIGSLMMQQLVDGEGARVNMSVPTDLLDPVLDDLVTHGRSQRPARPCRAGRRRAR